MARSRRTRLLGAGLAAAFVSTTAGYWLPAVGLGRIDYPLWNGNLLVPDTTAVSFAWAAGLLQTFGLSVLGAAVYALWVSRRLPGGPPVRGALWGIVVALPAGLIAMPLLYGAGIFGRGWDGALPLSLVLYHIVWGATLGFVYDLE